MTLYEFEELKAYLDKQNELLAAIAHNLIEVSKYFRNKNDESNHL